jgi:hypothetical protein
MRIDERNTWVVVVSPKTSLTVSYHRSIIIPCLSLTGRWDRADLGEAAVSDGSLGFSFILFQKFVQTSEIQILS